MRVLEAYASDEIILIYVLWRLLTQQCWCRHYFFSPNHCALYDGVSCMATATGAEILYSYIYIYSISIQYIQFDWNLSRDKAGEREQSFSVCPNWYCSVCMDACREHGVCFVFENEWMPLDWHIQCSFMWKKITEHIVITISTAFVLDFLSQMGNVQSARF